MAMQQEAAREDQPVRELRDSFILLGLTISSLGAYLGIGVLLVRLFATR